MGWYWSMLGRVKSVRVSDSKGFANWWSIGVAMVGKWVFLVTASDGRDVFRDDLWAVLGLECTVIYGQSWKGI
jgi:hypothetical protein